MKISSAVNLISVTWFSLQERRKYIMFTTRLDIFGQAGKTMCKQKEVEIFNKQLIIYLFYATVDFLVKV